jgi:hypothetical protein
MGEPSVDHLTTLMRLVFDRRQEAAAVGLRARDTMVRSFSVPHLASFIRFHLQRISLRLQQGQAALPDSEDRTLRAAPYKL